MDPVISILYNNVDVLQKFIICSPQQHNISSNLEHKNTLNNKRGNQVNND